MKNVRKLLRNTFSQENHRHYSPEYGIKPNTLSAWVTKYKSAEACQAADVHFVELKSTFIKEKQNMIIRMAGIEIEISGNSNAVIIREILAAMASL